MRPEMTKISTCKLCGRKHPMVLWYAEGRGLKDEIPADVVASRRYGLARIMLGEYHEDDSNFLVSGGDLCCKGRD